MQTVNGLRIERMRDNLNKERDWGMTDPREIGKLVNRAEELIGKFDANFNFPLYEEPRLQRVFLDCIEAFNAAFGVGNIYTFRIQHDYHDNPGGIFGNSTTYQQMSQMLRTLKAANLQAQVIEQERYVHSAVPESIAQDYREATRVMALSLKASATLARRCLQATLRDGFESMPRGQLRDEIDWVVGNGHLPSELNDVLHSLQKARNFGPHPADDGLTIIYELTPEDLEGCLVLLDSLFRLMYVLPNQLKTKGKPSYL